MPGIGFIRVKLLQVERGGSMDSKADVFDPYIAINVKEAVNTPGNNSTGLYLALYLLNF